MGPTNKRNIRLLVVDDEKQFRSTLVKRLQKRGVHALQAGSGEECLEVMAAHPLDVVVLDVKLPGMSGIEVLRQIKQRHSETEVILLTGHAATQDGVAGIKSGAFDYLTKPEEFEHLLGKIVQAYEKKVAVKREKEAAEYRIRIKEQMITTERLAALGTLAAGVAHEINNPLAIINEAAGYLNALLQKKELAEMPRKAAFDKALRKIESSVQRARTITHQLLGSVNKSEPILAEVDLVGLVNETVQLVGKEANDKEILIEQHSSDTIISIWVDPNQLRQILINLLSNAIHATSKQGRIAIQMESIAGGISIIVSDTGTGIPNEHLEKIFEPFFSTKAPGEGTGLGLFVTRDIVENLGGTMAVDSRLGKGTQFIVQIPDQSKPRQEGTSNVHRHS